jgi:N-hydroxyarylamine O-acetyltransferase
MDASRYLARIGLDGAPPLDRFGLEALQRAHLTHIPFENLHVFHRRGVSTDPARSIAKIVDEGRGGWCFELNGSFASLLDAIGFEVTRLGATVVLDGPTDGPQPSHASIRVDLERPYLVDVGFGDSFIRPLPLDDSGPHDGGSGRYCFRRDGESLTLRALDDEGWADQYRFSMAPVVPEDFDPSSEFLQTSPTTHFTAKPFATRLLDGGPDRVTLVHDRLKLRRSGRWTETPVPPAEWRDVLVEWFGMEP